MHPTALLRMELQDGRLLSKAARVAESVRTREQAGAALRYLKLAEQAVELKGVNLSAVQELRNQVIRRWVLP